MVVLVLHLFFAYSQSWLPRAVKLAPSTGTTSARV